VDLLVTGKGKATVYTYQSGVGASFKAGQTDIKVVLPDEARIEGQIVDPDTGQGIAGVKFAVVFTGSGVFYYRFVCTTDDNVSFSLGGLQSGEYIIRGEALPTTSVSVKSGKTTKVTLRANKLYYGRMLFEDGSPVVIKPEPWPGAKTRIDLVGEDGTSKQRVSDFDDEGYFKIYLSQEQFQQLQSGKAWFEVLIPYTDKKAYREEDVFAYDLLATDKAKAGVARIAKPKGEPSSLIGKPLPELKASNVDLPQSDIENKRMLVCFFDMQQRPSRNCIIQLAKQAEHLKEKGVTVFAIQAQKTDENTLREWIKTNNISFPVAMVQADDEETPLAWGVKSLPWLILTDRDHLVTAEGFGLNELNDKIIDALDTEGQP
jgi:peroxiredoxin